MGPHSARSFPLSMSMFLVLLPLLGACAGWRTSGGRDDLRQVGKERRVLVVTDQRAMEVDIAAVDERQLSGRCVRAWRVPAGAVKLDQTDDSPSTIARRNGWTPDFQRGGSAVVVPLSTIRYASVFEPRTGRMVALAVGVPLGVGGTFGLVYLFSLMFVACGRPLRVRGRRVITPVCKGTEWGEALPIQPVPDEVRKTLVDIWTQEAQAEHAAVAAFSKLSLELLALGAPPDLVTRANRAAIQEVEHARLCFALASAYRGEPLAPAPLPEALEGDTVCLERLARESLLDGCIREGIAAVIARLGAERAIDPEVVRVMRVQAKEESLHAALGWSIVEWCLEQGGEEMRAMLLRTLRKSELPRCDDLPEHGRVGRAMVKPHFDALVANARERIERFGLAAAA